MGFYRYALNEPSYNLPNVEKCIPIIFSLFLTYNEMSCTHILSVLIFFYMSCTAFQRHLEMSVCFFFLNFHKLEMSHSDNFLGEIKGFYCESRFNIRLVLVHGVLFTKNQHFLLPAWHVNLEGKYQSICVLVKL